MSAVITVISELLPYVISSIEAGVMSVEQWRATQAKLVATGDISDADLQAMLLADQAVATIIIGGPVTTIPVTSVAPSVYDYWAPKPILPDSTLVSMGAKSGDDVYASTGYWLVSIPQGVPAGAPDGTYGLDHLIT